MKKCAHQAAINGLYFTEELRVEARLAVKRTDHGLVRSEEI